MAVTPTQPVRLSVTVLGRLIAGWLLGLRVHNRRTCNPTGRIN